MSKHSSGHLVVLLVLVAVIPVATYSLLPHLPCLRRLSVDASQLPNIPPSTLPAKQGTIGPRPSHPPRITNVQVVDFDRDGTADIIACDARQNCVFWYRQVVDRQWEERILGKDLDLAPEIILASTNFVDDVEHCLKANTSPHLAEQLTGNRDFLQGTLGDLMAERVTVPADRPLIFSPFGLGVLDLAVGKHVYDEVARAGDLHVIENFFHELKRYG